ncbi:hypothetical protein Q5752_003659 [Cryptotrichosporon argae]
MAFAKPLIAGVEVPPLAIGTWSWGDATWDHRADDFAAIKAAWEACNEHGLTFYDTAEVYGNGESERIIGRLLADTSPEVRAKIYLATKYLPIPRPANWFVFTPGVVAACRKSLARLGVDQVELYQVHSAFGLHSHAAVGRELAKVVRLGLAKNVGVSNFSKDEVIRMADILESHGVKLASNQVEFSLLRKCPKTSGLLAAMKERGIACLAYSPLGMGRLTGKYSSANPPSNKRRFGGQYTWEQLDPLIAELRSVAAAHAVSPSAVALNWVMRMGAIPLGGARNREQAEQNAKATTFSLTDDEVARLSAKGFEGKTDWFWQHG